MKQLEKYYINFDELKEGDTVWHIRYGEARINNISSYMSSYQVILDYRTVEHYTVCGKIIDSDEYPIIYKSNPFLDLKEEPRMIEVLYAGNWLEREVIKIEDGRAIYWSPDKCYVYVTMQWREIQPKTLTIEQRIDELLEKVDNLKKILIGRAIDNIGTHNHE